MADSVPPTKIKDVQQVLRDVVNLGEWVYRLSIILIDTIEPESLVSFRGRRQSWSTAFRSSYYHSL